ncbi:MAG: 5'/3'-nucleotidase SurE [Bacteroidota bacterium]
MRPLILISNDDGITSRGIRTLVEAMMELGDVLVVAPDGPQSGMGHAITVGDTLRLEENFLFEGVRAFECSGTPADCVKIARHFVLKGERSRMLS